MVIPPGEGDGHHYPQITHCWGPAIFIPSPSSHRFTAGGVQKVDGTPFAGGFIWATPWWWLYLAAQVVLNDS